MNWTPFNVPLRTVFYKQFNDSPSMKLMFVYESGLHYKILQVERPANQFFEAYDAFFSTETWLLLADMVLLIDVATEGYVFDHRQDVMKQNGFRTKSTVIKISAQQSL